MVLALLFSSSLAMTSPTLEPIDVVLPAAGAGALGVVVGAGAAFASYTIVLGFQPAVFLIPVVFVGVTAVATGALLAQFIDERWQPPVYAVAGVTAGLGGLVGVVGGTFGGIILAFRRSGDFFDRTDMFIIMGLGAGGLLIGSTGGAMLGATISAVSTTQE